MIFYWLVVMRCLAFHPRVGLGLICVFVSVAQAQQLSFTPFHKSGICELGEKAGWSVALAQDTGVPASKCTYVIKKNNLDVIQEGTLHVSPGAAICRSDLRRKSDARCDDPSWRRHRAREVAAFRSAPRRFRLLLGRRTAVSERNPNQPRTNTRANQQSRPGISYRQTR